MTQPTQISGFCPTVRLGQRLVQVVVVVLHFPPSLKDLPRLRVGQLIPSFPRMIRWLKFSKKRVKRQTDNSWFWLPIQWLIRWWWRLAPRGPVILLLCWWNCKLSSKPSGCRNFPFFCFRVGNLSYKKTNSTHSRKGGKCTDHLRGRCFLTWLLSVHDDEAE